MEADDAVVGGVDLHEHGRFVADGLLVVAQVGAVGGPDLAQHSPALPHDLGDTKGAADLHELPARNHDLAPLGQGVEDQEHGRGVVVDHEPRLGPSQAAEQLFDVGIAAAALPRLQGQLQVGVVPTAQGHGLHGLVGQDGAAEIGVDDHARGVEDAPEMRPRGETHVGAGPGAQGGQGQVGFGGDGPGADLLAAEVQKFAHQILEERARQSGQALVLLQFVQKAVHRRDVPKE
ncbi:hypothetical protein DSECCO2_575340 [anaerobic digester metagenome]